MGDIISITTRRTNPGVGDFVKIRLAGPNAPERIWAQVTEVGPIGFAATLANDPVNSVYQSGSLVTGYWEDVLEWTGHVGEPQ